LVVAAHVLGLLGLLLPVVAVALWLPTTHSGGGHPAVLAVFGAWGGGLVPLQLIGPLVVWLAFRRGEPWAGRQLGSALLFHGERLVAPGVLTLLAPLGILVGVVSFGVGLLLYLVLAIAVTWLDLLVRAGFCVVALRRAAAGEEVAFPSATARLRRWWLQRSRRAPPSTA
jgi:uncharacterized Tic20 family protein